MKKSFEPVPGVIRVPLADPWTNFYCLVVPMPEYGENHRQFYLMCKGWGVVVDMFGCAVESDEDAAEIALANAPDYIEPSEYH